MSKANQHFAKLDQQKQLLFKMRHSSEHILTMAMHKFYPKMKMAMGPATDEGFYFDVDLGEEKVSEQDFKKIEKEMYRLINADLKFEQQQVAIEKARQIFKDNQYKQEWLDEIDQKNEKATIYITGKGTKDEFVDLCSGPHLESSKQIGAIKLLSVAGAYWRGDEKNKMLTRIYGTAFANKEDLKNYLNMLEEAKKRDHRKLGKELDLFFIDEMVGKGLIMWLPKGTIVRNLIEEYAIQCEKKAGYVRVVTPHIAKEQLYLTSGHLPYYKDSMFPGMKMDDGVYYLKGMNCPHHHQIFNYKPHSYKEMPIRIAEYGTCYRNELSGTLAGLLRVRGMAMNDAHIYCTKEQIKEEFKAVLNLTTDYFKTFGLKDYWFRLSKWSPEHTEKYIDQPENWQYSQKILREVLQEMNVPFVEADDEAAFYGPKVDVQFKSIIGREETMSTIQLDFLAKERFGLNYVDENGEKNDQVFVIHRAPLSVHERFLAFLLEQYAGVFPTWLAPTQVIIVPVAENFNDYAQKIGDKLLAQDFRVEIDLESDSFSKKIRKAEKAKVPYILIVGEKEQQADSISIRKHGGQDLGIQKFDKFISDLTKEVEEKK